MDRMDQKAPLALKVPLDKQVFQDKLDRLGLQDLKAHLVFQETQELQECKEHQDQMVQLVNLDLLDLEVNLVHRDQPENKDNLAQQAILVIKVPLVYPEKLVYPVERAMLESLVLQVQKDQLDLRVPQVHRAHEVQQVPEVLPVRVERKVLRDLRAIMVNLVILVNLVIREHRVTQVHPAQMEPLAIKVLLVLLDLSDLKVELGH